MNDGHWVIQELTFQNKHDDAIWTAYRSDDVQKNEKILERVWRFLRG